MSETNDGGFEEVEMARSGVLGVLEGRLTEEDDPAYFIDDIFYFNVRLLEHRDLPWLLSRLEDPGYARDRRLAVAANMTARGGAEVLGRLLG